AFQAVIDGDPREAWRGVMLGFRAAERVDVDPLVISKNLQAHCFQIACEALVVAAAHFDPTPDEFRQVDALLAGAERFSFRDGMLSEQAAVLAALESRDPIDILKTSGIPVGSTPIWSLQLLAAFTASPLGEPGRLEDQ